MKDNYILSFAFQTCYDYLSQYLFNLKSGFTNSKVRKLNESKIGKTESKIHSHPGFAGPSLFPATEVATTVTFCEIVTKDGTKAI